MKSKLLLRLLTSEAGTRRGRRRAVDRGFSVIAVVVVLLIVLSGSLAFALRGGSAKLESALQSQSREAREAAESGATQIIGELNREPNRRLLVSGRPLNGGNNSWANPLDGSNFDSQQQNPCTTERTTTQARTYADGNWNNVVAPARPATSNQRFRLRSVRYLNWNRSATTDLQSEIPTPGGTANNTGTFNNANDGIIDLQRPLFPPFKNIGYIQLVVEGESRRGNTRVAFSTITKEFEIVPKCCKRSFNGPKEPGNDGKFGNDGFDCARSTPGGLAIVVFSDGGITASGTISLLKPDDSSLDSIKCITVTASACAGDDPIATVAGSVPVLDVSVRNRQPPFFNFFPTGPLGEILPAAPIDDAYLYKYLRVNQAGNAVEECPAASAGSDLPDPDPATCRVASYCGRFVNVDADYHCRMASVAMTGSNKFIADTTGGKIALYFNDNSPAGTGGFVTMGPTARLLHRKCGSYNSAGCGTSASIDDYPRLGLYGDILPISGTPVNRLILQGTDGPLAMWVYFRRGQISLSNTSYIQGALWSNSLVLNGTITIKAAAEDPQTKFTETGVGGNGAAGQIIFDWVARSTSSSKLY